MGVNVELLPRVHDNGDVSMHIDLDISTVSGHVNLGGIEQPIIGQRKVQHDIRMHEGEVNLLGGLINTQDSKQVTGHSGAVQHSDSGRAVFRGERGPAARRADDRSDSAHRAGAGVSRRRTCAGSRWATRQSIKLSYAPKTDGRRSRSGRRRGAPAAARRLRYLRASRPPPVRAGEYTGRGGAGD